ncbi:MAG: 4Fe-4S binding protein [Syntrophaceae bacterium]|nr:4Fe-4S binding protein [Syntrophaceae bacterium]
MEKLRLKVQLGFAALFNIGLFQWHTVCFPVLNCHSCPTSIFACPMGIIGQFAGLGLVPLTAIGLMAIAGLTIGRFLCGWACPFGFFQELLYKVPYIKFNVPAWTRFIKYAVFIGLVVAVPIYLTPESSIYFCRICPVGTIESAIPWAIMDGASDVGRLATRLGILFGIMILAMGHRRFFCKVLCPLGACLSIFNRLALIFPKRKETCIDCGSCNRLCPMETSPKSKDYGVFYKKPEECISCLECSSKCPTHAVKLWG